MPVVPPSFLERRRLLRAGVVAAGVAAGAVAATAGGATKAEAASGDNLTLGIPNTADETTGITKTGQTNGATLGLSNTSGPTLFLDPDSPDWNGVLQTGEIINTSTGLLIGKFDEATSTSTTDYLVTGSDLAFEQVIQAITPTRLLDTRSNRSNVVGSLTATPFDATGRLKAFQWIDVAVESTDLGYHVDAAFLNLTATQALSVGNLTAYPPGDRPNTSTLNFQKDASLANGAFVSLGTVRGSFAVRIYTTATVHVILDYTGASVYKNPGPLAEVGAMKQAVTRRRRSSRQIKTLLGRKAR